MTAARALLAERASRIRTNLSAAAVFQALAESGRTRRLVLHGHSECPGETIAVRPGCAEAEGFRPNRIPARVSQRGFFK